MQPTTPFRRLLEAVKKNNLADVKAIIEQGADVVKLVDERGRNALHYAAYLHGSPSVTPAPLDPEASEKNLKIINVLIKAGADLDAIDTNGRTPLQLAISNANKIQAVKLLIEAGANPTDSLHQAAASCLPEIVEAILKTGKVDVNALDKNGNTPLNKALNENRYANNDLTFKVIQKVVEHLLDNGADPDLVDKNCNTTLINAVRFPSSKVLPLVELLLNKKVKIDIDKTVNYGNTALHFAAYNGHLEVAKLLLAKGGSLDLLNNEGKTPLHYAAKYGKSQVAELLLNNKARIDLPDNEGNTPLHFTAEEGNPGVAKVLLEKGALLDSVNNDGKTPLQVIAEKEIPNAEHLITAKLLLEKGADLEKIGKQSKLYPLLKIIGNLNDDEIKVVANNLEDFKTIYDTTLPFRNFKNSKPQSGKDTIGILGNDLMSMPLEHLLSKELKLRLGEELTSKLVKNLLETLSPKTLQSAQSSQIADSQQVSGGSPSTEFGVTTATKVTKEERERD